MEIADLNSIFGLFGVVILSVYYKIRELVENNPITVLTIIGTIIGITSALIVYHSIKTCFKYSKRKEDKITDDESSMNYVDPESLVPRKSSKNNRKSIKRDTRKESIISMTAGSDFSFDRFASTRV